MDRNRFDLMFPSSHFSSKCVSKIYRFATQRISIFCLWLRFATNSKVNGLNYRNEPAKCLKQVHAAIGSPQLETRSWGRRAFSANWTLHRFLLILSKLGELAQTTNLYYERLSSLQWRANQSGRVLDSSNLMKES